MQEMQKTWIQSLGWEDPLEQEMAAHSSIVAREIPWTEIPRWATLHGVSRVGPNLATKPPPPLHCEAVRHTLEYLAAFMGYVH